MFENGTQSVLKKSSVQGRRLFLPWALWKSL